MSSEKRENIGLCDKPQGNRRVAKLTLYRDKSRGIRPIFRRRSNVVNASIHTFSLDEIKYARIVKETL